MFVYVLKTRDAASLFKIGVAHDPFIRIKQLQTGCGPALELVHACHLPGEAHAFALEGILHDELKEWRCNGGTEWFKATAFKKLRSRATGSFVQKSMSPGCVEFYEKRIKGTPMEVQAEVRRLLGT